MNAVRKRKLWRVLWLGLTIAIIVALILYALRQNISLFYTPSQIESGLAPMHHTIRVGGEVLKGSVKHDKTSRSVSFKISDTKFIVMIIYQGILPDLFREGQSVVVQGRLKNSNTLIAESVLAKHDENYRPPELRSKVS